MIKKKSAENGGSMVNGGYKFLVVHLEALLPSILTVGTS